MNFNPVFASKDQSFDAAFESSGSFFESEWGNIQPVTEYVGGDPYMGDYTVVPQMDPQVLETAGKIMLEDVTVREVPVFRVSNNSGGTTVYIAKEV